MKFATKLILGTTLIISILFSLGASIMIRENFQVLYEKTIEQNINQHILYRYSIESNIRSVLENNQELTNDVLISTINRLMSYGKESDPTALTFNQEVIYYNINDSLMDETMYLYEANNQNVYSIKKIANKYYMYLATEIEVKNDNITLLNIYDISSVFLERDRQNLYYIKWFIIIILVYIVTSTLFTNLLLVPIKRLNEISKRMANGSYNERTKVHTLDEIGELSQSFDEMAESIEQHITKLEQDIKNREEFISDFSHELKTPMTALSGYSQLIIKGNCSEEIQKKSAQYIYTECKRLELLSKKMLKLMEVDKSSIQLVSVHTIWIKDKIENLMEPLLNENQVEWHNEWEDCFIKADASLILVLLKNLIENGIKASQNHVFIDVQGRKNGSYFEILVQDHGCGIAESELAKIINPFYRVDKSRAKSQGSSGLGLSICNKIAKVHGTELMITSQLGKGTKVFIKLEIENEEGIY